MAQSFKEFLIEQAQNSNINAILRKGITRLLRMSTSQDGEKDPASIIDAFKINAALETIRSEFKKTAKMKDGEKDVDFIGAVKDALKTRYLKDTWENDSAAKRRRRQVLYTAILEPYINYFKKMNHQQVLENIDSVTEESMRYLKNSDLIADAAEAFQNRNELRRKLSQTTGTRQRNRETEKVRAKHKAR